MEDKGAYRVVSVRVNDSGFRSTYAVEVQAAVGFEFADETFTVRVDVPEGFDQAVRRAVWKFVERAGEWNAENPDAITPRLEDADAYRVVVVRVGVDPSGGVLGVVVCWRGAGVACGGLGKVDFWCF